MHLVAALAPDPLWRPDMAATTDDVATIRHASGLWFRASILFMEMVTQDVADLIAAALADAIANGVTGEVGIQATMAEGTLSLRVLREGE